MAQDKRSHVFRGWAKLGALIVFIGFNLTFFLQFVLGYLGMPRRYHAYPEEFQVLNVMSSAGASILGVGYVLPMIYLIWSMRYGPVASRNPWPATGLEWEASSPPPSDNFEQTPVVNGPPYQYVPGRRSKLSDSDALARSGLQHHFDSLEQQHEASSLGMWVFLVTEVMFFGGIFTAYVVYRTFYPAAFADASRHLDITLGGVNTAVLICSSLTMALAVHGAQVGSRKALIGFLILTALLGLTFLGIKAIEYADKFEHHLVPGSAFSYPGPDARQVQLFFSVYFAMTGLHALHMIIGVGVLSVLVVKACRGVYSSAYHTPVEVSGLYWHFVDIVWIFLFPLLYLIGRHQ